MPTRVTGYRKGEGQDRCTRLLGGTDGAAGLIAGGMPYRVLASRAGVSLAALHLWIHADPERSQACARARQLASIIFDEMAEQVLLELKENASPAEIDRAVALAQHYRWRSRMASPARQSRRSPLRAGEEPRARA